MKDRFLLHIFLCVGLALAGCTRTESEWTESEAPNKLRVDLVRLQHDVAFAFNSTKPADGENEEFIAFLDRAGVTPDDNVYLRAANADLLTTARMAQLSDRFARRGVAVTTLPPAAENVSIDDVQVFVERYVVTPPDCPNWTKYPYGSHDNAVASNYGCSDATNFAHMIANPRDLVSGRDFGPEQGIPAFAAIDRYRAGRAFQPRAISTGGVGGGG
jgi:pilus assembly protein CpaD